MDLSRRRPNPAKQPLPGWLGRVRLATVLLIFLPACAAVGLGLASLGAGREGYALAGALLALGLIALPILAEAIRAQAAALLRFRLAVAAHALGGWLAALRALLPRQAAGHGRSAATRRRSIVPRPPALAGRRVVAALTLTPRLLPIPAARRA
jgi:hypothetical protein